MIAEVTGTHATAFPGMFRLVLQADGTTYVTVPETDNVNPDQRTYTYTKVDDNNGNLAFVSTAIPGVTLCRK